MKDILHAVTQVLNGIYYGRRPGCKDRQHASSKRNVILLHWTTFSLYYLGLKYVWKYYSTIWYDTCVLSLR